MKGGVIVKLLKSYLSLSGGTLAITPGILNAKFKAGAESNKTLLVKKLRRNILSIDNEIFEDIIFAEMMKEKKTGENVDRANIINELDHPRV